MARWFYVKKEKYGKLGWRLIEESITNGERECKTVPRMSFEALGVSPLWSLDQARDHVRDLNAREELDKKQQRRVVGAANRFIAVRQIESIFLPEKLVESFSHKLTENKFGSDLHNKRIMSHWKTVCKIIRDLKLDPQVFYKKQDDVYAYFIDHHYSSDYSKKLIRVMNLWGDFVCEHRSIPYRGIKNPRGNKKSKIDDSYIGSDRFRGESAPLTPELLGSIDLGVDRNNWLRLSVWFGLRPIEIDSLKKPGTHRLKFQGETPVLEVYQSKLTSIDRGKRWKSIPCIFSDQVELLPVIKSMEFLRPYVKDLNAVLDKSITLYGGRKGFVDLMLDRGQTLENISMWLGHQSIEMTWKKYRNKNRISWTPPKVS